MPIYEKKAYLMVEADSAEQAEESFAAVRGTSIPTVCADVGIDLDESPCYDQ